MPLKLLGRILSFCFFAFGILMAFAWLDFLGDVMIQGWEFTDLPTFILLSAVTLYLFIFTLWNYRLNKKEAPAKSAAFQYVLIFLLGILGLVGVVVRFYNF